MRSVEEVACLEAKKNEVKAETAIEPDHDIQAILTVIGRRSQIYGHDEKELLDLTATDLRGADLGKSHLEGALLEKANLEKAALYDSYLEGADLQGALLKGADLQNATLTLARNLEVEQIRLARNWVLAFLPEDLVEDLADNQVVPHNHNYRLKHEDLHDYNLTGMDLGGAVFYKFNLHGANFAGANLKGANFEGVNLRGALGLTKDQIASAIIDIDTKLPEYLKKPQQEKPVSK